MRGDSPLSGSQTGRPRCPDNTSLSALCLATWEPNKVKKDATDTKTGNKNNNKNKNKNRQLDASSGLGNTGIICLWKLISVPKPEFQAILSLKAPLLSLISVT